MCVCHDRNGSIIVKFRNPCINNMKKRIRSFVASSFPALPTSSTSSLITNIHTNRLGLGRLGDCERCQETKRLKVDDAMKWWAASCANGIPTWAARAHVCEPITWYVMLKVVPKVFGLVCKLWQNPKSTASSALCFIKLGNWGLYPVCPGKTTMERSKLVPPNSIVITIISS